MAASRYHTRRMRRVAALCATAGVVAAAGCPEEAAHHPQQQMTMQAVLAGRRKPVGRPAHIDHYDKRRRSSDIISGAVGASQAARASLRAHRPPKWRNFNSQEQETKPTVRCQAQQAAGLLTRAAPAQAHTSEPRREPRGVRLHLRHNRIRFRPPNLAHLNVVRLHFSVVPSQEHGHELLIGDVLASAGRDDERPSRCRQDLWSPGNV